MPDFSDEAEVSLSPPKTELRTLLLARRAALTLDARARAADRIAGTLTSLIRRLAPTLGAGYGPIGD